MPPEDPILQAASRLFGYRSLRPGQREAIQSVLDGVDTLAVMPTAGGKSAIYELSGPLLGGPTWLSRHSLRCKRPARDPGGRRESGAVALNSDGDSPERRKTSTSFLVDGRSSRLRVPGSGTTSQR